MTNSTGQPNQPRNQPSPCDVAALQKCLEEHKGDTIKVWHDVLIPRQTQQHRFQCAKYINSFEQACGKKSIDKVRQWYPTRPHPTLQQREKT